MRFLLLTCYILVPAISLAQVSDFITVKKKNDRTVKSYFPGSPIVCETYSGNFFNGYVEAVRNDSVFIKQYDIRPIPSMWGVSKIDTVATYITGVHYKNIRMMIFEQRKSFGFIRSGTIFIIGGLGYAGLNLINGGYLNEPVMSNDNRRKLGIAAGVAAGGFLLKYFSNRSRRNHKKYRIEYIRMNTAKPKGA
jgi:hypothetical protein